MVVGLIQDPVFLEHDTGEHPEAAGRLAAISRRLADCGIAAEVSSLASRPATAEELGAVHEPEFVEHVAWVCRSGLPLLDSADTAVCRKSYDVALHAAGAGLAAADRIAAGDWTRAFCAVRPPGHHAEHARAMGFCLFNNVAVLARYLQRRHGFGRVLILDWDVHHGNGTQHIFEEDPTVFYVSLHQWPFYPGTGAAWERGRGRGSGTTLNVPLPLGTREQEYLASLDAKVLPAIDAFAPEILLISAGFDAHADDPLGGLRLGDETFVEMSRSVLDLARRHCNGRVISLLEGGYDLRSLARCVELHMGELLQAGD
jgi:acetoin utilization deacetylase AcuC-like enzyme